MRYLDGARRDRFGSHIRWTRREYMPSPMDITKGPLGFKGYHTYTVKITAVSPVARVVKAGSQTGAVPVSSRSFSDSDLSFTRGRLTFGGSVTQRRLSSRTDGMTAH